MKWISPDRKIILIILGTLLASQIIYFHINVTSFETSYLAAVRSNLNTVGNSLRINLEDILQKGVSIQKFFGLKTLLREIISETQEISFIAIYDLSGNLLYYCDRESFYPETGQSEQLAENPRNGQTGDFRISYPLTGKDSRPQGVLMLGIDPERINRHVHEIAIDTGTIILISILAILDFLFFMVAWTFTIPVQQASFEIREVTTSGVLDASITRTHIDFLDVLIRHFEKIHREFSKKWKKIMQLSSPLFLLQPETNRNSKRMKSLASNVFSIISRFGWNRNGPDQAIRVSSSSLIRPALFLFVFSESLSISFLPIFAGQLYQPMPYLSRDIAMGLPISSFMLLVTISLPIGGFLAEKIGHRKSFLVGAVISAVGLLLSGMAETIPSLVVYRAIAGFGFGTVFMTAQMFIVQQTTADNRAEGMAIFLSAFYGGTLCGSAIGGMLSDRIGFRLLFLIGAAIAVSSTLFLMFISSGTSAKPVSKPETSSPPQTSFIQNLVTLFSDRNFAALVFFQSIPNKICLIGFVYYIAPLFLESLGSRQSDIGRYIMLYSLVMIIFSQGIAKWTDRFPSPKPFIFRGGLFSGIALLPCYFFPGVFWIALGIVLLGFSHAFSVSNQAKLASQLPSVNQAGLGPGLGIYRQAERIGNVLAPVLSGALISRFGYAGSLALIGAYAAVSSILFVMVFADKKENKD
ncbi:MAG: MFS transporter [Pseudomonadota bacterium]